MDPITTETERLAPNEPVRISESVGDLRAMAKQTRSLVSGRRNFDLRADDLALDGLIASTRLALSHVSLADEDAREVIFPRTLEGESPVEPLEQVEQIAQIAQIAQAPRRSRSLAAIRVLNAAVVLLVVAGLGGLAAYGYKHLTGEDSVARAASTTDTSPTAVAIVDEPVQDEIEISEPATLAPVAKPEPEPVKPHQAELVATKKVDPDRETARSVHKARSSAGKVETESAPVQPADLGEVAAVPEPAQMTEADPGEAEALAAAAAAVKASEAVPAPAAAAIAEVTASATVKVDEPKSLTQLLDDGADDLKLEPEEEKKPVKTRITRDDLKTAMGRIRGRIHGCAARTATNGIAKLKFRVKPSGKVGTVSVAGKLSGSEFETCVKPAVKRAKFPAYDGPPSTFTFPVQLTR